MGIVQNKLNEMFFNLENVREKNPDLFSYRDFVMVLKNVSLLHDLAKQLLNNFSTKLRSKNS